MYDELLSLAQRIQSLAPLAWQAAQAQVQANIDARIAWRWPMVALCIIAFALCASAIATFLKEMKSVKPDDDAISFLIGATLFLLLVGSIGSLFVYEIYFVDVARMQQAIDYQTILLLRDLIQ